MSCCYAKLMLFICVCVVLICDVLCVHREYTQLSVKGMTDYEYEPVDEYGGTSIQVEKYQIERLPTQDAFSDLVSGYLGISGYIVLVVI